MKKLLFLLFFILLIGLGIILIPSSKAQDAKCNNPSNLSLEDISKCLDELNSAKQQSENATKPLEVQINGIKQRVAFIEQDITIKGKNIADGYANLAKQQQILNATIRDFYIKSYYNSPLLILLSANSASQLTQLLGYQKANADRDKAIITNIAIAIQDLKIKKDALENEQQSLIVVKAKLDKVVTGAKAYQANLSSTIAQLSAKQQQILASRLASLNIPLSAATSAHGCVDDRGKDPGFSPKFAFFTYGVPNRVGLNQYGAWGRAKDNHESAEQILQDYYPNLTLKKDYDTGATVNVDGNGTLNIEYYVKRIYEMPSSWTDNNSAALEAQAVAARSYGLAHRGGICTTESCQVFKPGDTKGGAWDAAVDTTKGWVMVDGSGNPVSTQYSSTHGGYILDLGKFDGDGGTPNSFSDLTSRAWDGPSHANSPWFYCDWGGRGQNNTAFLRSEEVTDIVNVIMLMQKDSGVRDHLYQTDKSNPAGTDTWDAGRVRQELQNRGGSPYNNVNNISISADFGSGKVSNVSVSGDAGSNSFSGSDFKNYFNLRAPANIQIVGPLYNVER